MANVTCEYCGESYDQSEHNCPLCGADNKNFVGKSEPNSIVCAYCGTEYNSNDTICPLCGAASSSSRESVSAVNNTHNVEETETIKSSAQIIDEESEYVPPKKERKPYKKQEAPNNMMVLVAYVGILIIIISLVVGLVSGVSKRSASKIGVEIFESQDYDNR